MIFLYVEAPFAVFRTFAAGTFRPTAPFFTYSAAYGFLLNLAGMEMRHDDRKSAMTLIRSAGLPAMRLALGAVPSGNEEGPMLPITQTLYQQVHNYPVGSTGKENAGRAYGSKYNIAPAKREVLYDLKAWIGIDAGLEWENRIGEGLLGKHRTVRYGLPFLGDNNFLPNRAEVKSASGPAHWYVPLLDKEDGGVMVDVARLTLTIDRKDMAQTKTGLFYPEAETRHTPSSESWIEIAY